MNLSVAIPDSCLKDEATKLDKSRKVSLIARTCAIFGVRTIYIYEESGGSSSDRFLLSTILRYLETPQYLRRALFPKIDELKYAGILHPLQISHHSLSSNPKELKEGDIREGAIIYYKGKKFVDIGIRQMIPYFGKEHDKKRITVQIKTVTPNITIKEISEDQIKQYWGYKVKERSNLIKLLEEWNGSIIMTSRKGKPATLDQINQYVHSDKPILVVFGAPDRGLYEILGTKINIKGAKSLNFFPDQATETVRLEEAMLGILSILNFANSN
ncbi:MAG: putative RNA uridine N3 methyltransferase [Thermoproteota archaeon]